MSKVFTENEASYCKSKANPSIHFAGKFSAKEAVKKALSNQYKDSFFSFKEISIINNDKGRPSISINNIDSKLIDISISHTNNYAISFAILKTND